MSPSADQPGPGELRASDADREAAAQILTEAAGDGRIGLEELDGRIEAIYAARTYAELAPVTADLPARAPGQAAGMAPAGQAPASSGGVAIMSRFERRGAWVVRRRFTAFTFWGGGTIDLREARFCGPEVKIRAITVMGGVEIIVPDDADVYSSGVSVMGGFQSLSQNGGAPGVPRIRVKGLALLGGVFVKRPPAPQPPRT